MQIAFCPGCLIYSVYPIPDAPWDTGILQKAHHEDQDVLNTTIIRFCPSPQTQRALYLDVVSQGGRISKLLAALVPITPLYS